MSVIFISDLIQIIGSYLRYYEDIKNLKHTCKNAYYLKYNIIIGEKEKTNLKYNKKFSKHIKKSYNITGVFKEQDIRGIIKYANLRLNIDLREYVDDWQPIRLKETTEIKMLKINKTRNYNDAVNILCQITDDLILTFDNDNSEILRIRKIYKKLVENRHLILSRSKLYKPNTADVIWFPPNEDLLYLHIIFYNYGIEEVKMNMETFIVTKKNDIPIDLSHLFKGL